MICLGIDAGGTSTRATLVDGEGRCIGYGVGGRGNPVSSGTALAASGVLTAIASALDRTGHDLSEVRLIVAAMAGSTVSATPDWLLGPLAEHGFSGRLAIHSDLLATYFSGAFSSHGYAMVSGTGAAAIRVAGGEVEATVDGLGWLLGDHGSGFWIGREVVLAATADLDGRGPRTALTARVLAELEISQGGAREQGRPAALGALVTAVYGMRPVELARLAPLAFGAGDDLVANSILSRAGDELARTVSAVYDAPGPLVMGGSVLAQPGALADRLAARLAELGFAAAITRVSDGAIGSAVLALREAGIEIDAAVFDRISASIAERRSAAAREAATDATMG